MTYRRLKTSDTWHWRRDCSHYPTRDIVERPTKPSGGDLCNECKAKDRAGQPKRRK